MLDIRRQLAIGTGRGHSAALGVAAHYDQAALQMLYGILNAPKHRCVHYITRVADGKNITKFLIEKYLRRYP